MRNASSRYVNGLIEIEGLVSIKLMRDRSTNEPQGLFLLKCWFVLGFGFIDFATEEDAINALNGYNGRPIRNNVM